MFHRCDMATCHHAHRPHGFFRGSFKSTTGRRLRVPLGVVCSLREAWTLHEACVRHGLISENVEDTVRLQLEFSDLPAESPWDEAAAEDFNSFRLREEFVVHFTRVYFRHVAWPETVRVSSRDWSEYFLHPEQEKNPDVR